VLILPKELEVLDRLRRTLCVRNQERFVVLALACIVAMGRRTVSRLLWAGGSLMSGHPSRYHRFFSAARWSLWTLAHVLVAMVLECVPADQPVFVLVDDTVTQHRGKRVHGNAWHRDPIRSSQGRTILALGHKWVVLAINVMLPCGKRPWALPVLAALYVPPSKEPRSSAGQKRQRAGRKGAHSKLPVLRTRHAGGGLDARCKSPCLLARQMMATLIRWFPDRQFILLGDGGFASHELALFCHRHRKHVTLVARFCPDASLYALPPERTPRTRGRRRSKGKALLSPQKSVVAASRLRHARAPWYSQRQRDVQMLSASAAWYRCRGSGRGAVVPVRWVYAREMLKNDTGYFYSTDPKLSGEKILEYFTARWCIEVTFQEVRAQLGFHTTRQRCKRSVQRAAPCLLGLFSVVSLIYRQLCEDKAVNLHTRSSYVKTEPTFADALAAVRRVVWQKIILPRTIGGTLVTKLPQSLQDLLLDHLTAAA
jgi:hypothetical protein